MSWEPLDCAVTREGRLELTSKSEATLSEANKGQKIEFSAGAFCNYEAAKLKGPMTSLTPVRVQLAGSVTAAKGSEKACPRKRLRRCH